MTNVVIIGAGPYGLSLAAHLRDAGIAFRIFGKPMAMWRERMPVGMQLKSDGCASSLYTAHDAFPLSDYCARHGIPYEDRGRPVDIETFIAYGHDFQQRFASELDQREVVRVEQAPGGGFVVHLADGEAVPCAKVVVAVGITYFAHVPPLFEALPRELLTHSSEHVDVAEFAGREVGVVGAGASALDTAALLHKRGAKVTLVSRRSFIDFIAPPNPHETWLDHAIEPPTDIGPGWKNVFCTYMPQVFHFFPLAFRREVVRRHLGPAPGWFAREQTEGRFPFLLSTTPVAASAVDGRIRLRVKAADGSARTLEFDHIIAATGYKVDLNRIPFLQADMLRRLRSGNGAPALSLNFESVVPGLYFTGLAAAESFGPLLRFACGAKFASRQLARHLVRVLPSSGEAGLAAQHVA